LHCDYYRADRIAVSCNCLKVAGPRGHLRYEPIEARLLWQPGEAIEVWRQHVAEAGEAA